MIEEDDVRAVRGGTGFTKCGGNYAASLRAGEKAEQKGFSQVLFDLPDGSAIGLSTARYYTGGGVSLIGTGLTPDPLCSLSEEDEQKLLAGQLEPQEDEQLQAAIQAMEK